MLSRAPRPRHIVLEGILGVYNYGCEAIVRGTAAALHAQWPSCRVRYASARPVEDERSLNGADVEVTPLHRDLSLLDRARRRLKRQLPMPPIAANAVWSSPWIGDAECILQIGGDMLTLVPSQRGATQFPQVDHLNELLATGRPVVLWGASVGPFDGNDAAVTAFGDALRRLALITAREPGTARYLRRLGITDNVVEVADPAFLMPAAPLDSAIRPHLPQAGKRTVAVNLSPHAVHYAFEQGRESDALSAQAELVATIVEDLDADVLLVPHVIYPGSATDDDAAYLETLETRVPTTLRPRVRRLPSTLGATRTKTILASCQAVVAARMHCAVAAVSSGVPTLFVSYSGKALGMAEFVYGDRDLVVGVDAPVSELVDRVAHLLRMSESLSAHLVGNQPRFVEMALAGGRALATVLEQPGRRQRPRARTS